MAIPANKIEVRLSADQRATLQRLVRTGTHPAHARRRAAILLRADADGPDNWTDDRIAQALGINRNTVWRVRAQFAAEGLDATLHKRKATGRQYRKLDGAQEARLIALACSLCAAACQRLLPSAPISGKLASVRDLARWPTGFGPILSTGQPNAVTRASRGSATASQ